MARDVPKHLLGIVGRLAKEIDSQGTKPIVVSAYNTLRIT